MNVEVLRYSDTGKATLSLIMVNGKFICYGLEDTFRKNKIWGETRIPEGTYKMGLRKVGRFHGVYSVKFRDFHKGMLHVLDVPNYKYILIHIGNSPSDTAGCLITGSRPRGDGNYVYESTQAYKELYPIIIKSLINGEDVTITYKKIYS